MKTSLRIASHLGLLSLLVPATMGADWKPHAGDRLRFELAMSTNVKYDINGRLIETRGNSTLDLISVVKNVAANGNVLVTVSIDRLRTSTQSSSSKSEFDTNQKLSAASSPLAPFYMKTIGASYTATISPAGEVLELKIPASLTESLSGTPFLGPNQVSSLQSIESTLVSPETIQALVGWLIPRKATAANPIELPLGQLRFAITNRRISPEVGVRVENETEAVVKPTPGVPIKVNVDRQKGHGVQIFDASNGLLTDSSFEQSADLTIGNEGRTFHQTIELTARLRCLGLEPVKP